MPDMERSSPSKRGAAVKDIQLDAICKRQTARFLDHLRRTGQHTIQLERDFMRLMQFVFHDIKKLILGSSTENQDHERS